MLKSPEDTIGHISLCYTTVLATCRVFPLSFTLISVFVYVWLSGMNYELTIGGRVTQRKRSHLWGTDVSTLITAYNIQTSSTNCHLPPSAR